MSTLQINRCYAMDAMRYAKQSNLCYGVLRYALRCKAICCYAMDAMRYISTAIVAMDRMLCYAMLCYTMLVIFCRAHIMHRSFTGCAQVVLLLG